MPLQFTRHAIARIHKRGIPPEIVDLVHVYGRWSRKGRADAFKLDAWGRAELREALGERAYERWARRLGCYVVVSDDACVITAAYPN